jgi:hypothetical protein
MPWIDLEGAVNMQDLGGLFGLRRGQRFAGQLPRPEILEAIAAATGRYGSGTYLI